MAAFSTRCSPMVHAPSLALHYNRGVPGFVPAAPARLQALVPQECRLASSRPRRRVCCAATKPDSATTDGTAASEQPAPAESAPESGDASPSTESKAVTNESIDSLGAEIARVRKEREQQAPPSTGFLQGVIEETRMIEWPAFSSVLSTTGLVLAVIVSATFAILVVNAILAELSDAFFSIDAVSAIWRL